jgi:hypothetical protein
MEDLLLSISAVKKSDTLDQEMDNWSTAVKLSEEILHYDEDHVFDNLKLRYRLTTCLWEANRVEEATELDLETLVKLEREKKREHS